MLISNGNVDRMVPSKSNDTYSMTCSRRKVSLQRDFWLRELKRVKALGLTYRGGLKFWLLEVDDREVQKRMGSVLVKSVSKLKREITGTATRRTRQVDWLVHTRKIRE